MKTKFKKALHTIILMFYLTSQGVFAQIQTNNNFPNFDVWTQVNPSYNAQSIGIGDFNGQTPQAWPLSALHINTNYLPASPTFNAGEVFRTQAPDNITQAWRMMNGTANSGAGTEVFSILNPGGTKDLTFRTLGLSPVVPYERVRISQASSTINGTTYGSATRIGISYAGTSAGFAVSSPAAMLHLGRNVSSGGYRNWMDLGTYIDWDGDHAYFGLKDEHSTSGHMDAVIAWGDNQCSNISEHYFRIISLAGYNATCPNDPAYSTDGIETMRITQNGYVGIGDYKTLGSNPYRTLDVLGNAAIRTVTPTDNLTKVLVWDNSSEGLIKYRELSSLGGGNVNACASPTTNYLTRWTSASTKEICNSIIYDNGTRAGIGTTSPGALFDIVNTNSFAGLRSRTTSTAQIGSYGVWGQSASTSSVFNIGTYGAALNTSSNIINNGIWGVASGNTNLFNVGGVFITQPECVTDQVRSLLNIGVYARGTGWEYANDNCAPGTAAIFNGNIFVTGSINPPSDLRLKDSITAYSGALQAIHGLLPVHYVFKKSSYPSMQLPVGGQIGFIAQQVDTVLPQLISEAIHPPLYDSSGTLIHDTIHYKAVNYTGLIPITIAAIQEQQQMIDSLAATQISAQTNPTDTNRIVKWSNVNNVQANSLLYDNGTAIGLPGTKPGSFFNVANTADSVALSVSSTHSGTTAVVDINYNGGTAADHAVAVRGTSIHAISGGGTGGRGGLFEGGEFGVGGIGRGSNEIVVGVLGTAEGGTHITVGVHGYVEQAADSVNAGVIGTAENSSFMNVGSAGVSTGFSPTGNNYGHFSTASGSDYQNFGGHFLAQDSSGANYGIYAETAATDTNDYAGYFKGNVHYTGRLTAGSDAKLKANVQPLKTDSALALLAKLQPKTYTYNSSAVQNLGMPTGKQYGLIAQEVQQVLPELVSHITQPETRNLKGQIIHQQEHYLGLNYQGIIPVLIGAVKEQQQEIKTQQSAIDSLKNVINNKLAALENRINNCCGIGGINHKTDETTPNENAVSVELSNTQVIVLEQNAPNPFAEQTTINYHIPTGMGDGQMVFTDMLGNIIKTAEVKNGYGTVTVFAQNLSSGQYSYTLMVNGKTIATKKMVKQR